MFKLTKFIYKSCKYLGMHSELATNLLGMTYQQLDQPRFARERRRMVGLRLLPEAVGFDDGGRHANDDAARVPAYCSMRCHTSADR